MINNSNLFVIADFRNTYIQKYISKHLLFVDNNLQRIFYG